MATSEMKTLIEGKRWILKNSKNEELIEKTKNELQELLYFVPTHQHTLQEEEDIKVCVTACGILIPMLIVPIVIFFNGL